MPTTISGSSGVTFPDATTQTTAATASVPAGAVTNFVNASAPTGWTQVTTYNNYAMRVVSGTGAGTGGSVDFTTAFANGNAGSYTLATADIPSHSHLAAVPGVGATATVINNITTTNLSYTVPTNTAGGGGSHTHSLSLAVRYVDNILCQKS